MSSLVIRSFVVTVLLASSLQADDLASKEPSSPAVQTSLDALWKAPVVGSRRRASSANEPGKNHDYVPLQPGDTAVLLDHHDGPGTIRRIWFTIDTDDADFLTAMKLRFQFDNEVTVQDVPIGMLTASGPWRVNDVVSPVVNVTRSRPGNRDDTSVGRGGFNLLWPMPFARQARIELINGNKEPAKFFFYVDYQLQPVAPAPLLFHATHHCQHFTQPVRHVDPATIEDANHLLADIKNHAGRYVGTILAVESHPDRAGKWYEGDDRFLIDGETFVRGTGTEDYFGMAWGFHRLHQAYDYGVSHYERNLTPDDRFYDGRFVTYRWHLRDPIPFQRSLHASIESGHANDCAQHYESVAVWYGRKLESERQE